MVMVVWVGTQCLGTVCGTQITVGRRRELVEERGRGSRYAHSNSGPGLHGAHHPRRPGTVEAKVPASVRGTSMGTAPCPVCPGLARHSECPGPRRASGRPPAWTVAT